MPAAEPTVVTINGRAEPLPELKQLPYNIEAEQALLGALLIDNSGLHQVNDFLTHGHFYEPLHQRIFATLQKFADKGLIANPVTLKHYFEQDESIKEIGGVEYLAKLIAKAGMLVHAGDYGRTVYDLALKRKLVGIGEEISASAYDQKIEKGAIHQIEEAEQKLFNLAVEGDGDRSFEPLRASVTTAIQRIENAFKNPGHVTGITTGFTDLDKLLGGLQKSDLVILAGRPSMGKTALATNMAYNAAEAMAAAAEGKDGKPLSVGFFSLEMSAEQLAARLLSAATGIISTKLRRGDLGQEEFTEIVRSSRAMAQLPLFIDDTPALSIAALRTRARRLKRMHNLGLLVIDYLQLIRGVGDAGKANRVQEVSEITQGLKAIAKELDIPVVALSQLSRAVEQREDKKPQLSDLRESGSIEQDADVVLFVFREEYYLARAMPREGSEKFLAWQQEMEAVHGVAEVIIAKQRSGPIGTAKLQFQSDLTKFGNLQEGSYGIEERMG